MTDGNIDRLYKKIIEMLTQTFHSCFPLCCKIKNAIHIDKPFVYATLIKIILEKKKLLRSYNKYPRFYNPACRACRIIVTFECRMTRKVHRVPNKCGKYLTICFREHQITELNGRNG